MLAAAALIFCLTIYAVRLHGAIAARDAEIAEQEREIEELEAKLADAGTVEIDAAYGEVR